MRSKRSWRARLATLATAFMVFELVCRWKTAEAQANSFEQQLTEASVLNSLDAAGVQPWHMTASYTRFDTDVESPGTLEIWSLGKDQTRIQVSERGHRGKYVVFARDRVRSNDGTRLPRDIAVLVRDLQHPFPDRFFFDTEKTEDHTLGPVHTKCFLVRDRSETTGEEVALGKIPSFCVDQAGTLRVAWFQNEVKIVNENSELFQRHPVPRVVTVFYAEHRFLEARVNTLEAWNVSVDSSPDSFVPPTTYMVSDIVRPKWPVPESVMQAQRLTSVPPIYPAGARADHVTGRVELEARIGGDGTVAMLRVVSSPREDLSAAALKAVWQWTYKPRQWNGISSVVDTTITVNFNLSP